MHRVSQMLTKCTRKQPTAARVSNIGLWFREIFVGRTRMNGEDLSLQMIIFKMYINIDVIPGVRDSRASESLSGLGKSLASYYIKLINASR